MTSLASRRNITVRQVRAKNALIIGTNEWSFSGSMPQRVFVTFNVAVSEWDNLAARLE